MSLETASSAAVEALDLTIHIKDLSILSDVKRPSFRQASVLVDDAVSPGRRFAGIAQYGIVRLEGFGKPAVFLSGVAACGKVGNVQGSQGLAILTE